MKIPVDQVEQEKKIVLFHTASRRPWHEENDFADCREHEDIELRESARSTLRGFIDRIVITPGDALLQVVGDLGEMLTAAGAQREAAAVGNVGCGGGI